VGFLGEGLFLGGVLGEEGDGESHEGADGAAAAVVVIVVAVAVAVAGAVVTAHVWVCGVCIESGATGVRCLRTMRVLCRAGEMLLRLGERVLEMLDVIDERI
jgi:hypothetical protein